MKSTYSEFMQSKYFDGLFNAAIFDGPYRVYFHQNYESLALKIYFLLGQKLGDLGLELRDFSRVQDIHIFILIYPDSNKLNLVFSKGKSLSSFSKCENWDEDLVIGLETQFAESEMEDFIENCQKQVRDWAASSDLFQDHLKTKNMAKNKEPFSESLI